MSWVVEAGREITRFSKKSLLFFSRFYPPLAPSRRGIKGEHIAQPLKQARIDYDQEVSEARQDAWDEYKAAHLHVSSSTDNDNNHANLNKDKNSVANLADT